MKRRPHDPIPRAQIARTLCLGLFALWSFACSQQAEPRWLLSALPGSYPEVVYFVPTDSRAIALTVDDGLDAETTAEILDVLRSHKATATFFVVSNSLPGNEHLIERMLAGGHEIGHHMTNDEVTVGLDDEELERKFTRAARDLEQLAPISWFRPGSGRYNERVLELTRERGYRIALASVAPLDTLLKNPGRMAAYIRWMVEPGSVVVLHDVGKRGSRTVETLELLLPKLRDDGYAVMSLSELDGLARPPVSSTESG